MSSVAALEAGIDTAEYAQFRADSLVVHDSPLSNLRYFPHPISSPEARPLLSFVSSGVVERKSHWPERHGKVENAIFNARQQLIDFGASNEIVTTLFTENGEWAHVDESGVDFLSMEADDAFEYLVKFLQPEFYAVSVYLDEPGSAERPYNEHGEPHARKVKEISKQLLEDTGHIGESTREMREFFKYPLDVTPKELELCSTVAAAVHDIGYMIDPEFHPLASIEMAEKIFPQIKNNPKLFSIIERTILLHESDNLNEELAQQNITTPAGIIDFFEKEYPTVASIAIADKIDQGEDRVRVGKTLDLKELQVDPRTFLEDMHVEDNLLMRIKSAGWMTENLRRAPTTLFRMVIDFNQEIPAGKEEIFRHFAKERSSGPGKKIDVSRRTRQRFLESNGRIEYFDTLVDVDLAIGAKRKLNSIYASFALNPFQDMADIVYQDESRPNRIRREHFTFFRNGINEDAVIFQLYADAAKQQLVENAS